MTSWESIAGPSWASTCSTTRSQAPSDPSNRWPRNPESRRSSASMKWPGFLPG